MRASHLLAVVLAIGATVWVLSGQFGEQSPATAAVETAPEAAAEAAPVAVRVAPSTAQPYTVELVITGRTEASRIVDLRAETAGRIEEILVREGEEIEAGETIVRMESGDRNERLQRAQALVERREIEAAASAELAESGWRAETSDAAARADLQDAHAELAAIRLDIARTTIEAPFPGVLEALDVELGDVIDVNASVGTVYDLDPVIVVAAVSEREIVEVHVGQAGKARLITGQVVEGTVRFVSKVADPTTRTFRVELEVANEGLAIAAGVTADVLLPLAAIRAHFVSPAVLSLADDGTLGVKIVDAGNVVRFVPVTPVADEAHGIWLAGLPESVTLITVGHDYVVEGQTVEPVTVEGATVVTAP